MARRGACGDGRRSRRPPTRSSGRSRTSALLRSSLPVGSFVFVLSDFLADAGLATLARGDRPSLGHRSRRDPGSGLGGELPRDRRRRRHRSSMPRAARCGASGCGGARRAGSAPRTRRGMRRSFDGFIDLGLEPVVLTSSDPEAILGGISLLGRCPAPRPAGRPVKRARGDRRRARGRRRGGAGSRGRGRARRCALVPGLGDRRARTCSATRSRPRCRRSRPRAAAGRDDDQDRLRALRDRRPGRGRAGRRPARRRRCAGAGTSSASRARASPARRSGASSSGRRRSRSRSTVADELATATWPIVIVRSRLGPEDRARPEQRASIYPRRRRRPTASSAVDAASGSSGSRRSWSRSRRSR